MAAKNSNDSGRNKARPANAQPVPYWANPANAEHGTCRPGEIPGTVIFNRTDGQSRTLHDPQTQTSTPAWVRALQSQDEYVARPGKKPGDVKIQKTGKTVAWEGPAEIPYWAQSTVLDEPTHFARPGGVPIPVTAYDPRRDPTQKVEPVTAGAAVYDYARLENEFERGNGRKGCGIFRRSSMSRGNKAGGHSRNPSGSPASRHVHFANPVAKTIGSAHPATPMPSPHAQATPAQSPYSQTAQAQAWQQPHYAQTQTTQAEAWQQQPYPQTTQAQVWQQPPYLQTTQQAEPYQQPPPMYYWNPPNGPYMPMMNPAFPYPVQMMPPHPGQMPPYPGY